MNSWSRARKRIILLIFIVALVVLIGLPLYFLSYRAPNCFDAKKNGDESGVDCGGSCQLLCTAESLPLIVKGDPRVLTLSPNVYEVVSVIENPNLDAEVKRARYTIKIFSNTSNIPVKEISGETFVPKASTFAIFVPPFILEEGVEPTRATLEWDKIGLLWEKNVDPIPELRIGSIALSREDSNPRVNAVVENPTLETVSNVELVVILSDESGNIFAASKTVIDTIVPQSESPVVFTWPGAFTAKAVEVRIVPRVFPDRSFIR